MRLASPLPFALLLSLAAFAGCQRGSGGAATPADAADVEDAVEVSAENAEYDVLIAGNSEDGDKAMEAREYLDPKHEKNGYWKFGREEMLKWTEALYAAGAAKVYAPYSPADDTIQFNLCAALLVELPADKAKRASALETASQIEAEVWGSDADTFTDAGQKYVYLSLDP